MESVASPISHKLEENLTISAVSSLFETLTSSAAHNISFDAGSVKHLDWPVVQLFLSAAKTWRTKNQTLTFTNVSEGFQFGLEMLGIELDLITSGGTA